MVLTGVFPPIILNASDVGTGDPPAVGAPGQSHQTGPSPDAVKRGRENLISRMLKLSGGDADSDPQNGAVTSFGRSREASRCMICLLERMLPSASTRLLGEAGSQHGESTCGRLLSTTSRLLVGATGILAAAVGEGPVPRPPRSRPDFRVPPGARETGALR